MRCYYYLKELDLRMCDYVPDEIIYILKLLYKQIKIYNYYGEDNIFCIS